MDLQPYERRFLYRLFQKKKFYLTRKNPWHIRVGFCRDIDPDPVRYVNVQNGRQKNGITRSARDRYQQRNSVQCFLKFFTQRFNAISRNSIPCLKGHIRRLKSFPRYRPSYLQIRSFPKVWFSCPRQVSSTNRNMPISILL